MQHGKHTYELSLWQQTIMLRSSDGPRLTTYTWDTLRHSNADYELHIILGGSCSLDVEDHTYHLHKGQAVLLAPGCYHRPQTHPVGFERFTLNFTVSQGKLLLALQACLPLCQVLDLPDSIIALCRGVIYEGAAGNPFRQEMLQAMLTQLMVSVLRLLKLSELPGIQAPVPDEQDRTGIIDAFFERHMADRAGEDLLAKQLHLSKRQLARVLQKHYGMGFQQKLIYARMDRAAWLLRSTDKRVSEIAGSVGYSSEAAFYQIFRNRFGVTPQQYRAQFQKSSPL